jgi:hypothetical protein
MRIAACAPLLTRWSRLRRHRLRLLSPRSTRRLRVLFPRHGHAPSHGSRFLHDPLPQTLSSLQAIGLIPFLDLAGCLTSV